MPSSTAWFPVALAGLATVLLVGLGSWLVIQPGPSRLDPDRSGRAVTGFGQVIAWASRRTVVVRVAEVLDGDTIRVASLIGRRLGRVRLVCDPTQTGRDRYGRLLRYVQHLGVDVDEQLLAAGAARPLTWHPPITRTVAYLRAARGAQQGRRGLWDVCTTTWPRPHRRPPATTFGQQPEACSAIGPAHSQPAAHTTTQRNSP